MAQGRSLADLRARREALVRSMEQNRVQLGTSLRDLSTRVSEVKAAGEWIGDHPALSMLGAFTAGVLLPSVIPRSEPQRPSFVAEVLGPLLRDSLRSAAALLTQGEPSALRPTSTPAPAPLKPG